MKEHLYSVFPSLKPIYGHYHQNKHYSRTFYIAWEWIHEAELAHDTLASAWDLFPSCKDNSTATKDGQRVYSDERGKVIEEEYEEI